MNVLFGQNGSGKSSILDAIALNLSWYMARLRTATSSGKIIQEKDIYKHASVAQIELTTLSNTSKIKSILSKTRRGHEKKEETYLSEISEWAKFYREQRDNEQQEIRYPLFVQYGVHRSVLDIPLRIRVKHDFNPLEGYDNAFAGGSNFRTFFEWFRYREDIENERRREDNSHLDGCLESVRYALEKIIPELSDFKIRRQTIAMLAKKDGEYMDVSQLSDGEKCLLALVGDIARRLSILNAKQTEKGELQSLPKEEILSSSGIVLIDELDLHLHPKWQRRVIAQLPKVFPKLQFIVSTHSPQMIGEVSGKRIYCLDQKSSSELLEPLGIGKGLSSNEVLEVLMDTPIWETEFQKKVKEIDAFIDKENWASAWNALETLKGMVENSDDTPVIQRLSTEIQLLSSSSDD